MSIKISLHIYNDDTPKAKLTTAAINWVSLLVSSRILGLLLVRSWALLVCLGSHSPIHQDTLVHTCSYDWALPHFTYFFPPQSLYCFLRCSIWLTWRVSLIWLLVRTRIILPLWGSWRIVALSIVCKSKRSISSNLDLSIKKPPSIYPYLPFLLSKTFLNVSSLANLIRGSSKPSTNSGNLISESFRMPKLCVFTSSSSSS
jgi:hypothetical protein